MTRLINIQLIETDEVRGNGIEGNPYRRVKQWFSTDGVLLLEQDPSEEDENAKNLIEFLNKQDIPHCNRASL